MAVPESAMLCHSSEAIAETCLRTPRTGYRMADRTREIRLLTGSWPQKTDAGLLRITGLQRRRPGFWQADMNEIGLIHAIQPFRYKTCGRARLLVKRL